MTATREFWAGRHLVYRCYDQNGRLLYVGKSGNLPARLDNHRSASPWLELVARMSIRVYSSHEAGLAAEREAIATERPLFNLRSTPEAAKRRAPQRSRQISVTGRELMRSILAARRLTVRELAQFCGDLKHRSAIGHLVSGNRVTCNEVLAGRIQEVLLGDATDDRIFLPERANLRVVA